MKSPGPLAKPSFRNGFSLLEVLVACGILVVGLASVAAILPAAAARLGEAAAQDRAAAAAALAMSEIQCRNLSGTSLFAGVPANAAVVFGETLSLAVTQSATSAGYMTSGSANGSSLQVSGSTRLVLGNAAALNARINNDTASDTRRGYFLEDEIPFAPSSAGNLPANAFENGARKFNRGFCWGTTITPFPDNSSPANTNSARVSIAVFRKPGAATAITLTATNGIFQTSGVNTPSSLQRTILKPCSAVLAVSGSALPPKWLAIRSSWITGTTPLANLTSATTCVVFENTATANQFVNGSQLTVVGFDNLLLVTEQLLSLK